LRWRGIEATLQLSQSTNAKVVVIGSGKDGLPIILGNVDAPAPPARSTTPDGNDNKERTTAASPAVPLEKTPAAALATPAEKIPPTSSSTPSGTSPERSRSLWPISLSDIETYLTQMLLPTERKTEPRSRQPSQ
jgi:prohibitin 1